MSLNFCFEISDSYKLSDSLDMSDMKKNNKISRWLGHELPAFPLRSLDSGVRRELQHLIGFSDLAVGSLAV